MDEITTTLPAAWQGILAICGMIAAIGGAAAIIAKMFAPFKALEARLTALEKRHTTDQEDNENRLKNDLDAIQRMEETQQQMCRCIVALMDNAITGNSIDRLKTERENMSTHLIERSVHHDHHH